MCYSIMVETNLKKLEVDFNAIVDTSNLLEIYQIRDHGVKNIKIPRSLNNYLDSMDSPVIEQCKQLEASFKEKEKQIYQSKIELQDKKILELNLKLEKKWTKTSSVLLERAMRVKDKAVKDLDKVDSDADESDGIIHQYTYSPVIEKSVSGQNIIRFKRYQLRPSYSKEEAPSKINMFNARLDALEMRPSWRNILFRNHGAVILKGFYEWVDHPTTHKKSIVYFYPESKNSIWVPCLYDAWQSSVDAEDKIYSFAIITTDPSPEIEAVGHDRSPIFPRWDYMDRWLDTKNLSKREVITELTDLEKVKYAHKFIS